MSTLVFGYYNMYNLGDEMYKITLPRLFPKEDLIMCSPDDIVNTKCIKAMIFGGGDIINDYFHSKLKRYYSINCMKIGIGVGIPFPDLISTGYIDHLDHLFIRNKSDLPLIENRIGSEFSHYLPDPAFLLSHSDIVECDIPKKTIGVFPIPNIDINYLNSLLKSISRKYKIVAYRFDTSGGEIKTTDTSKFPPNDDIHVLRQLRHCTIDTKRYSTQEMLGIIKNLHACICYRFHSHIFSTIVGTPFISLTKNKKVIEFLKDNDLSDLNFPDDVFTYLDNPNPRLKKVYQRNSNLLKTDQLQNLLNFDRRRTDKTDKTPEQIYDIIVKNYPDIQGNEKLVAQTISLEITNDPESKYVYGTIENLLNRLSVLDMIKWMISDYHREKFTNKSNGINLTYLNQIKDVKIHRSGWNYAVSGLMNYNSDKGILVDVYLDRTFHWCEETMLLNGVIPYTNRWVGFIHHTTLEWYTEYNVRNMFRKESFIRSLEMCCGIFVLSNYLNRKITEILVPIAPWVPVYTVYHPTDTSARHFDFDKFKGEVIQVGAWMRDSFAIYRLKTNMRKKALKGVNMDDYYHTKQIYFTNTKPSTGLCVDMTCRGGTDKMFFRLIRRYIREEMDIDLEDTKLYITDERVNLVQNSKTKRIQRKIDSLIQSVELIEKVSDDDYDRLLETHCVFVKLFDASAVNTLIECVVRNTPILISKLPAVVEVLGHQYPLYFESLEEASTKLNYKNILLANQYLKCLDKSKLYLDTFVKDFMKYI